MLRDNLAGLIEPMIDRAGTEPFGGHPKPGPPGGCSRSTAVAIVALKRSWRQIFRWKTGRRAENGKWPAFEVTTAAHDSRAVGTAQHQSHRTIDPQCLKKSPPRRGGSYALTENVASPFHAEPRHFRITVHGVIAVIVPPTRMWHDEHESVMIGIADTKLDISAPNLSQTLNRVCGDRCSLKHLCQPFKVSVAQLAEQFFLVGKMQIDRGRRVFDLLGYSPHRDTVKPIEAPTRITG